MCHLRTRHLRQSSQIQLRETDETAAHNERLPIMLSANCASSLLPPRAVTYGFTRPDGRAHLNGEQVRISQTELCICAEFKAAVVVAAALRAAELCSRLSLQISFYCLVFRSSSPRAEVQMCPFVCTVCHMLSLRVPKHRSFLLLNGPLYATGLTEIL